MSATNTSQALNKQERLAAWVQFPRRVVLWLIAIAIAQIGLAFMTYLLIAPNLRGNEAGPFSLVNRQPVSNLIGERLPNTLFLLGSSIVCAIPLIAIFTIVALLTHRLETNTGLLGSIFKGLGRGVVFAVSAAPVILWATALISIFVLQLKLGPALVSGPGNSFNPASFFLPLSILVIAPAALTAQSISHILTHTSTTPHRTIIALLHAAGVLLRQVGGILSMAILVEALFGMQGIGSLLIISLTPNDWPVIIGVLSTLTYIVLAGQLAAELFLWLERLQSNAEPVPIVVQPTPWQQTARRAWVVFSLALLLVPVGVLIGGIVTGDKLALTTSLSDSNDPPSAEHPWGTDRLGRDLQARGMRGLLNELGSATVAALITGLISIPFSALAGYLFMRHTWWADSIADVLLLPANAALLIPALPLAAVLIAVQRVFEMGDSGTFIVVALMWVLLPRTSLLLTTLWATPSSPKLRFVAAPIAAWLLTVLIGFGIILSLDALGLGIMPPTPTIGETFSTTTLLAGRTVFMPGLLVLLCAFALYTAADGLIGYFNSKAALALRNT